MHYWVIAPYYSRRPETFQRAWNYDLEHNTIAIGWKELGDVSDLEKEDIRLKGRDSRPNASELSITSDVNTLWRFYNKIRPGDTIIARKGRKTMIGVGEVTGTAYYDPEKGKERVGGLSNRYYPNFIDVKWKEENIEFDNVVFGMQTLTGPYDSEYYEDLMEGEVPEENENEERDRFSLESHLEDFIVESLERIFDGKYRLFVDEDGLEGVQYPATNMDGRRLGKIDILVEDSSDGSLVVIELKRGNASDKAVGQVLRYMGWIKAHVQDDVSGLIICTDKDEKLEYALEMVKDLVDVKYYSVSFSLTDSPDK